MRKKQQEDVSRIYNLAVAGQGEITAAAVLAAHLLPVETLEQATRFVQENPKAAKNLLQKELYFRWIEEGFLKAQNNLGKIDFRLIAAYDKSGQDTKSIFYREIYEVSTIITNQNNGIFYCLDHIFRDNSIYEHKKLPISSLEVLGDVRQRAKEILGLCNRILHPYRYWLTDKRLITASVTAFLCAIPLWYLLRTSSYSPIDAASDIPSFSAVGPNSNGFMGWLNMVGPIFQFYLAVPSILLLPAVVTAVARKHFNVAVLNSNHIVRYEAILRDTAMEIQKILPNPPSFPTFTVKELSMKTGDIIYNRGNQNTIISKSNILNSLNQVKGKHGKDVDTFLEELARQVIESNDPKAAKLYEKFNSELKDNQPTGSILKGIWDGLVKVLPEAGKIAGAAETIMKLTSD